MKKCDEQAKIRDEQAREAKMEGKMRADFLDRRTGFTGGLGEWLGYEDGRRRLGGSASSPDPFFSHGQRGIAFRHTPRRIHHGAFEEGLDRINRIFRIIGIG
jgi:hypothetical protein